ncbi:hypothetical protein VPHD148_0027 [Vibrio phage D148]
MNKMVLGSTVVFVFAVIFFMAWRDSVFIEACEAAGGRVLGAGRECGKVEYIEVKMDILGRISE